jgi:arginase
MGSGPDHFLLSGLDAFLRARGHTVAVTQIDSSDPAPSEIKTAFELYRSLSGEVRAASVAAAETGSPPSARTLRQLRRALGRCRAGGGYRIAWFDAHGDFNTPETTLSGYLDGMGLAIACGLCWTGLARTISGFRPIPGENVLHLGGSDLEAGEVG